MASPSRQALQPCAAAASTCNSPHERQVPQRQPCFADTDVADGGESEVPFKLVCGCRVVKRRRAAWTLPPRPKCVLADPRLACRPGLFG